MTMPIRIGTNGLAGLVHADQRGADPERAWPLRVMVRRRMRPPDPLTADGEVAGHADSLGGWGDSAGQASRSPAGSAAGHQRSRRAESTASAATPAVEVRRTSRPSRTGGRRPR